MKYDIILHFVREHRVRMIVVPFDYDSQDNPDRIAWDGLFLSNGHQRSVRLTKSIRTY